MQLGDRFIPTAIQTGDPNEYERAQLTVKFSFGFGLFTAGFGIPLLAVGAHILALYNVVIAVLLCLSPLLMRLTGEVKLSSHCLVFLLIVVIVGESVMNGGVIAPTAPMLVLVPMVSVFVLDRSFGAMWTVVSIVLLVAMQVIQAMGYEWPSFVPPEHVPGMRTAAYGVLLVLALLFVLQYDSIKRQALAGMHSTNHRIKKMIVHVEATSEALSRSTAEFLGSTATERNTSIGLTQQMMNTASSGREVIEGVGNTIHGMIRHYKQISERVHELYKQSGTIAELVLTIDRISERLDLMALNTGIEATHAGQAGKRFMLLADDMRRLAERVSTETLQIKNAIRLVQQHTEAANNASLAGQTLTDEGVAKLELMSRALDDMYKLIERTAEASKRITQVTETQIAAIHSLASASTQSQTSN